MMDSERWNQVIAENGQEFLQSWEWGEFQKALGKRVERIQTPDFLAQVIFNALPLGLNYGYVPRGPTIIGDAISERSFWSEFEKIRDSNTVFFEFDLAVPTPLLAPNKRPTRQPKETLLVDLLKTPDELFRSLHKMHRINIRRAEKNNLQIKQENDWRPLYALMKETARHQSFRIWPARYFEKLFAVLKPAGMLELQTARSKDNLIAAHLYILFGSRATYLYGASNYKDHSLMAPHLLHWQAIREFQRRGFREYDFWGLDEERFPGVTAFKRKFGGLEKIYPGSRVRVLKAGWHKLYQLAKLCLR